MANEFVGAIVLDANKQNVLLQKRDANPATFPLCWTLFGGGVEDIDQSAEIAVRRELQEEIHLAPDHIRSIKEVQRNVQPNGNTQVIFEVVLVPGLELTDLTLSEGEEMRFFPLQNVLSVELKFGFNIEEVLQRYIADPHIPLK